MTGLLVSVRNADEARLAAASRVDLIDVKEPLRGSLGRADVAVWRDVLTAVGRQSAVSVALGELLTDDVSEAARQTAGVAFAKIGLAGCARQTDWQAQLQHAFTMLVPGVAAVAVVYADAGPARAPPPAAVLDAAIAMGCQAVLVDTYDKSSGSLLDHLPTAALGAFVQAAQQRGLQVVLGGSLTLSAMPRVLDLAPDYIAVRGAVCRGPRHGPLDHQLVSSLVAQMRSHTPQHARPLTPSAGNLASTAPRRMPIQSQPGRGQGDQ